MHDKVVLVTGAGSGIGREVACKFYKKGWCVAASDRNGSAVHELWKELGGSSERALCIEIDVTSQEQIAFGVERIMRKWGRLDVLVNNAGIVRQTPVWNIDLDEWHQVIEVNLTGTFLCSQAASRVMAIQKRGRIINISSIAAIRGSKGEAHYSAAKAGVIGLTKSLAIELAPYGITVNAVIPGVVRTKMLRDILLKDPQREVKWVLGTLLKRLGTPKDIASVVYFLASEDASWITGTAIVVDGGKHLGYFELNLEGQTMLQKGG